MKEQYKSFWTILAEHEIVRRYVIINSFDGALTVLGIIMAEFLSSIQDPKLIILPGIGAAVAMCVSGMWGAYAAERAEIKQGIRTMEIHMLKDLSKTDFTRKRHRMAGVIGLVDGLSPLIASLVILIPFFLVKPGILNMTTAYYTSMVIVAAILFLLGMFAGRIARESMIKQGIVMLLAGVMIGVIFIILVLLGVL